MTEEQQPLPTEPVKRSVEAHVTVGNVDPIEWFNFCHEHTLKPLYIELSNHAIQLMCAVAVAGPDDEFLKTLQEDFREAFPQGEVLRVKVETNLMTPEERSVYYECHVKIDGPMRTDMPWMSSRDLYRKDRWYLTLRSPHPFDGEAFYRKVIKRLEGRATQRVVSYEYEVAILDTNPGLDAGWDRS